MTIIRDYHVHTSNSIDSEAVMEEYCSAAVEKGVREIVFTDHFDLNPLEEGRGYFCFEKYNEQIERCRRLYGDRLTILKGLELGETHLYAEEHFDFLKDKGFDFLLGSVHWVGDEALHTNYCSDKEARNAYDVYFSEALETARKGDFDVLGHLDLLKRYAPPEFGRLSIVDYRERVEQILKALVERGKGLELNTSGWRQGLDEPFPTFEVLQWYKQLGGEIITVGSDSHVVRALGSDICRGYRLLRELGFKWLTIFRGRKMEQVELPEGK